MIPMTIPREDCYEWIFYRDTHDDGLDILRELREGIEELPETTATFRLSDVTDVYPTLHSEEMLWLQGSWEVPDRFAPSRAKRYVNPGHVHRKIYTDITVECECGALIARERNREADRLGNKHFDHCEPAWKRAAEDALREKRRDWIEQAADLYLTYSEAAPRLGVCLPSMSKICQRYGIDWRERRKEGRERAIYTWRKLHDEYGHTYPEIAEAWGAHPGTVRTYASGNGRNIDI